MKSRSRIIGALVFFGAAALTPALPAWIVSLAIVALANALVVLGLIILWRAGLVPFGQALFYAIGAYAVALIARYTGLRDALLLLTAAAILSGLAAFVTGFLLARYREIFFAMLSLAMSMILYGVLVKTQTLGSTDGFHVGPPTYLGHTPQSGMRLLFLFWLELACCALAALLVSLYLGSVAGALAVPVRDSELRLEFLGVSVNRLIHLNLVIAGTLAGIGGALAAFAIEHVDPNISGGDAFGDGQEPRPVDPRTDQLEGTAEVIEIDGNGHVSTGLPAPSHIISHDEPVDTSVRRQVHQVLMMLRDNPEEPGIALLPDSPS
jgi:branched-chain amino acid transport system permease protein